MRYLPDELPHRVGSSSSPLVFSREAFPPRAAVISGANGTSGGRGPEVPCGAGKQTAATSSSGDSTGASGEPSSGGWHGAGRHVG